jgi:hypothetical protein
VRIDQFVMRAPNYQIFLDAQHIGASDRGTTFETEHVRRDRKRLPGAGLVGPHHSRVL